MQHESKVLIKQCTNADGVSRFTWTIYFGFLSPKVVFRISVRGPDAMKVRQVVHAEDFLHLGHIILLF